mmetsp:Transcript_14322/g.20523  ORF Transcript_14322/g.20523 Transcript_14322/m.20523 type:complete len:98 (+) Transcript_14322:356-649(+)
MPSTFTTFLSSFATFFMAAQLIFAPVSTTDSTSYWFFGATFTIALCRFCPMKRANPISCHYPPAARRMGTGLPSFKHALSSVVAAAARILFRHLIRK